MNGLSDLRVVRSQQMMTYDQDNLHHHLTMLMLHKFLILWCSNHRLTVQEVAEECNISTGPCHNIISQTHTQKLEIHWITAVCLTAFKIGSERQLRYHAAICQECLDCANENDTIRKELNRWWNVSEWIQCKNKNSVFKMCLKKFRVQKRHDRSSQMWNSYW